MAKRRKRSKLPAIILIAAVIAAAVVFGPRLVHKCDSCGKTFVGTGYYTITDSIGNAISGLLSSDDKDDKDDGKTICKDCAESQYKIASIAGKTVDDFRRPLF